MALIKCVECGAQVSTKAKVCPSCGAKVKRPLTMIRFIAYVILAFFLMAVLARCADHMESSLTPEQRQAREQRRAEKASAKAKQDAEDKARDAEKACMSDVTAFVMSQRFVTDRLKAPASAKYPTLGSDGVRAVYVGDCSHKITAYVDAQNAFGALIRTRYTAKLKLDPATGKWKLLEIKIEQ